MFTILNRYRGTYGWFAKVVGVGIWLVVYYFTKDVLIASLLGVGYWFGEMICGWGDHVGNITGGRMEKFNKFPEDGDTVGVRWLTSVICYPKQWRMHLRNARVGLLNIYPRTMNMSVKGWSLGRLLGVQVALKPIEPLEINNALMYSRVFLVIRGIYWWTLPMIGVSMLIGSYAVGAIGLAVLSLGWPIAAEIGYLLRNKVNIHMGTLSYEGGWELQEGAYGALQDIVFAWFVIKYWIGG